MIHALYRSLLQSPERPAKGGKLKRVLLRFTISCGILLVLLWWLPIEQLLSAFASVPAGVWFLVFTGFLAGHLVAALKWRLLLRAAQVPILVGLALRAHGAGLFANLCLPSIVGGDMVRAALVMRERRSRLEAIALGSLTDRLIDTFALMAIAGMASLFVPGNAELPVGRVLAAVAALLLLAVPCGLAILYWLPEAWVPEPAKELTTKLKTALNAILKAPQIALFGLALSIAVQCSFVSLNYLLARTMGIEAGLLIWLFAWPMAKLIALAPVSLGGLGVREAALAGLMLPFGVPAGLAVAQSLSWQAVLICAGLAAGLTLALLPDRGAAKELIQGEGT